MERETVGSASVMSLIVIAVIIVALLADAVMLGLSHLLLGWTTIYICYLVIVVFAIFVPLTFLILMSSIPVPVFFRAFSLYYLGEILPQYNAFSPPPLPPADLAERI